MSEPVSFYDQVGGMETFRRLVDAFYRGVASDEVLKPMYPEEDLGPAAERLTLFLAQYWGGPATYGETRGHPRLRMRHMPFHVDPDARDRWLRHMRAAVDEIALPPRSKRPSGITSNALPTPWSTRSSRAGSVRSRTDDPTPDCPSARATDVVPPGGPVPPRLSGRGSPRSRGGRGSTIPRRSR